MVFCCICKRTYQTNSMAMGFSFHSLPCPKFRPEMHEKWVQILNEQGIVPTKYSKVCSEHFEKNCFIAEIIPKALQPEAYPTIFSASTKSDPGNSQMPQHSEPKRCFYIGCENTRVMAKASNLSVHVVPQSRSRSWALACGHDITSNQFSKVTITGSFVCGLHFLPSDFRSGFGKFLHSFAEPIPHPNAKEIRQKMFDLEKGKEIDIRKCWKCRYIGCDQNLVIAKENNVTLHRFKSKFLKEWLFACGYDLRKDNFPKLSEKHLLLQYVCSRHFKSSDYVDLLKMRLKDNAIPIPHPNTGIKIPYEPELPIVNSNETANIPETSSTNTEDSSKVIGTSASSTYVNSKPIMTSITSPNIKIITTPESLTINGQPINIVPAPPNFKLSNQRLNVVGTPIEKYVTNEPISILGTPVGDLATDKTANVTETNEPINMLGSTASNTNFNITSETLDIEGTSTLNFNIIPIDPDYYGFGQSNLQGMNQQISLSGLEDVYGTDDLQLLDGYNDLTSEIIFKTEVDPLKSQVTTYIIEKSTIQHVKITDLPYIDNANCCYLGCNERKYTGNSLESGLWFHKFRENQLNDWLIACGYDITQRYSSELKSIILRKKLICSKHFPASAYRKGGNSRRLKPESVPIPHPNSFENKKKYEATYKREKKCRYLGCEITSKTHIDMNFYRFPPDLTNEWLLACGYDLTKDKFPNKSEKYLKKQTVCSRHFKSSDFKDLMLMSLKPDAIPIPHTNIQENRNKLKEVVHIKDNGDDDDDSQSNLQPYSPQLPEIKEELNLDQLEPMNLDLTETVEFLNTQTESIKVEDIDLSANCLGFDYFLN